MRSRNVSPGLAVMRTTIWSDSTRVPPVTAERSPPDSRITGADSPVMADSSTLAMPSMISPSPGIISPADDDALVAELELAGWAPRRCCPSRRTWATVSERALRSESACALPRPSAMASAKLANSTVNHSHAATRPAKRFCVPDDEPRSRSQTMVVRTLPTSTTNITGLRAIRRGSSLTTRVLGRLPDDRRRRAASATASGRVVVVTARGWVPWRGRCSSEAQAAPRSGPRARTGK